jgi:hypothetical protein
VKQLYHNIAQIANISIYGTVSFLHRRSISGIMPFMILPEIKRVVRFDEMAGKTIQSVEERTGTIRIVFTDGKFADLEPSTNSTIVIGRTKPSRDERRKWRESRG